MIKISPSGTKLSLTFFAFLLIATVASARIRGVLRLLSKEAGFLIDPQVLFFFALVKISIPFLNIEIYFCSCF